MSRAAKTAGESPAAKKPRKIPQPHGGALHSGGVPGNRGGGRPPNEWRRRMAELTDRAEVEAYLAECLRGEHGPKAFMEAYRYATEQAHGKPTQPVDAKVSGKLEVVIRDE